MKLKRRQIFLHFATGELLQTECSFWYWSVLSERCMAFPRIRNGKPMRGCLL